MSILKNFVTTEPHLVKEDTITHTDYGTGYVFSHFEELPYPFLVLFDSGKDVWFNKEGFCKDSPARANKKTRQYPFINFWRFIFVSAWAGFKRRYARSSIL